MAQISKSYGGKWMSSGDVPRQGIRTVISEVTEEEIGRGSDQKTKLVAWLKGQEKGLVLNKTNGTALAEIYGDETDDWAHARRYDRVLDMIAAFDGFLNRLWTTIQAMPDYRGTTTLIVTSDHGRGATLEDWHGHGSKVQGADKIWLAMIGPDTPASGEVKAHAEQRDITPTIIKLMGLNTADYAGATGKPIDAAFKP